MANAIDSTHRIDVSVLKANGLGAIIRYGGYKSWKTADKAEIDYYRSNGIGVGIVMELNTNQALRGHAAGVADAQKLNTWLDSVGWPLTEDATWACDTDASYAQVSGYAAGFKSASKRPVGAYGGSKALDGAANDGYVQDVWQANARSWSYPGTSPHADVVQHLPEYIPGAGSVDPDTVLRPSGLIWYPYENNRPVVTVPAAPAFPAYKAGVSGLRLGDKGQQVAVYKLALKLAGYGNLVDLSTIEKAQTFGPGTAEATKKIKELHAHRFPHDSGWLPATDLVGPETWKWAFALAAVHQAQKK